MICLVGGMAFFQQMQENNKRIKCSELQETNLDTKRFHAVMHLMRTKQFEFTASIMASTKEIKCSACNQIGHNRKNKMCPLHPTHPIIEFDNSDESDNEEVE